MTIYDGNRYDGWNEYITYGGIPLVILTETEEQKTAMLDHLFTETYIRDIVKRNKIKNNSNNQYKVYRVSWRCVSD